MSTDTKRVPLDFKAGINRENTQYTTGGYWYNGNRVRFRNGKPENIRGWQKKVATPFNGVARAITSWASLSGNLYAALGTDQLLYIYNGGTLTDITPINASATTSATAPIMYTSTNSKKILVDWVSQSPTLSQIGLTQNTFVLVSSGGDSLGGITLDGQFRTSIPADLSTGRYFKIIASSSASGNATRTSATNFNFLLNAGSQTQVEDLGYGTGLWNMPRQNDQGYGVPASVGTGFAVLPRSWSFSNWGEDLIACPRNNSIYIWKEDDGTSKRAEIITSCPTKNILAKVSPLDRHLVAFGTNTLTSVFDPMLVRWSSQEDYNDWITSVGNTAGEQRLGDGSKIITAINSRNQILIWTDNALHSMTFVGVPFVFSFQQLGTNCGAIGLHSAVEADGRAFWMSQKDFYMYDGALRILPCSVNQYIFDDMNTSYFDKVFAAFNKEFTEVTWLYPSSGSTECDRYVTYNPAENWWAYGEALWTSWEDKKLYDTILTTGNDSYLYDNEPDNIYTGDGSAIESFIESGSFDLDKQTFGNNMVFVDRIIPDFNFFDTDGDTNLTIKFKKYPQSSNETTKGPFNISGDTEKVRMRGRGRDAIIKIERGTKANTGWRYGSISMDMVQDGER
jgi:hypothetical protein|tara:strand:- start:2016 stop:3881 length:1866 start_codon:yes stop_codon:yes gene_type:complete